MKDLLAEFRALKFGSAEEDAKTLQWVIDHSADIAGAFGIQKVVVSYANEMPSASHVTRDIMRAALHEAAELFGKEPKGDE